MNNKNTDATQFSEEEPSMKMVSARTLHYFFDIKTPFNKWWDYTSEFSFDETNEYSHVLYKGLAGRTISDYVLTLGCAASICLLQRTDKGDIARHYFNSVNELIHDPAADHQITIIDDAFGNPFSHTAQGYFRERLELLKFE
ncbi:antA/AntB antirepressor family protein [Mucilaginibacter flavidus]|uniref:antA/AntB antirepressor family protein n=1 Tax=Mucilaginibacter flavidus TaxID=2949309 RepID=UPI002093172A|nr:antA/AntB antirepressor family protein [Mucilaginibacter flavidus]MCO5948080.1 antA/AntB antirepressor family protein [Mucilaginibacter flavidus]